MPRRKRASTIKLHSGQIERYIRPLLGGMAVADVTREDMRNLHRRTTDTGGAIAGTLLKAAARPPMANGRSRPATPPPAT